MEKKDEQLLDDFVKGAKQWHDKILDDYKNQPCIVCGISPKDLLRVSELVDELREKAWMYDNLG